MTDDPEALRRLEERVAALEHELSELRARAWLGGGPRAVTPRPVRPPAEAPPPRSVAPGVAPGAVPATHPRPPLLTALSPPARTTTDLEQWFGQRGLLLVGVVALIAAGGFFLKYAFDRGWIAPWLRVLGALVAGTSVALLGERQIARDLKRYGAGLIGGGAGLAYLGLWAAAGPYALVPRGLGAPLLAVLTAVVAWRATVHRVEVLAGLAVAGAFLAPVFLPAAEPSLVTFLVYLEVVAAGAVGLALRTRWTFVFTLTLIGYFVLPVALAGNHLESPAAALHGALGGLGVLMVTAGRAWPALRLAGLLGAWLFLIVTALQHLALGRVLAGRFVAPLAAGAVLALVALAFATRLPLPRVQQRGLSGTPDAASLVASPLGFAVIAAIAVPDALRPYHGLSVAVLGLLYAAAGWKPRAATLMSVAAGLLVIAIAQAWDGTAVTVLWMALALGCTAIDRRFQQEGLQPMAVGVAWLAGVHQMVRLAGLPAESTSAFADSWALALYACVAGAAVAALLWRRLPDGAPDHNRLVHPDVLWALSALLLFVGVSVIIARFFGAHAGDWAGAVLAGRLALSVWWLLYAAGAVQIGFALNLKGVRSVGLVVAGVAAVKIGLYDLSNLEALYRVGAFFGLALVALAVAYLYSRRARLAGGG